MNILGIDRTKKKNEELAANAKATLPFPTLKGKRITFSGKVAGHTRAQLTSLLKKHGAQIEYSVSRTGFFSLLLQHMPWCSLMWKFGGTCGIRTHLKSSVQRR